MIAAIKPIARIIDIKIETTLEILWDPKKFTTGNNNTERMQANAKGIKIFWAALIK
jgi:hypothetical protein